MGVARMSDASPVCPSSFGGYSHSMAGDVTEPRHYVLFVTGPLRERLYRRFATLFAGRDVDVRVDRRVAERRHEWCGPYDAERRRGDRRRRRPDWIVPPPEGV